MNATRSIFYLYYIETTTFSEIKVSLTATRDRAKSLVAKKCQKW